MSVEPQPALGDYAAPTRPNGYHRWVICGLLFFATTINYIDRAVLGVLAPDLQKRFGWTDTQYGDINMAFSAAYAIGFLLAGWFLDRVGTRICYGVSLIIWSIAAAAHALARSAPRFAGARIVLGLGETRNFSAAIKTTAECFPNRDRAFATGIFNAGSNIGAVLAPLLVPVITIKWGWQVAFIITGLLGFLWVFLWWPLYRKPQHHPLVSPQELAYIQSDCEEPTTKVPWLKLFPHRQTWAFAVGKFLTDPIWWFYLTWSAKFF